MCLYMSSSMFTFRNIIIATDGEPVPPVSEVRRSARASHSLSYHGAIHLSSVPAYKLSTAATGKKERAKRAGRFTVPHWGLTSRRNIRIGKTNLCYFFTILFNCCLCNSIFICFWVKVGQRSNNKLILKFLYHLLLFTLPHNCCIVMVLYRKDVLLRYSHRHVPLPQV